MVSCHLTQPTREKSLLFFWRKVGPASFFCIYAIQVTEVTASFAKFIAMTSRRQALKPAIRKIQSTSYNDSRYNDIFVTAI